MPKAIEHLQGLLQQQQSSIHQRLQDAMNHLNDPNDEQGKTMMLLDEYIKSCDTAIQEHTPLLQVSPDAINAIDKLVQSMQDCRELLGPLVKRHQEFHDRREARLRTELTLLQQSSLKDEEQEQQMQISRNADFSKQRSAEAEKLAQIHSVATRPPPSAVGATGASKTAAAEAKAKALAATGADAAAVAAADAKEKATEAAAAMAAAAAESQTVAAKAMAAVEATAGAVAPAEAEAVQAVVAAITHHPRPQEDEAEAPMKTKQQKNNNSWSWPRFSW